MQASAATVIPLKGFDRLPSIDVSEPVTNLEPYLYYLEDSEGLLSLNGALSQLKSFEPVPNGGANFGLTTSVYWFAFRTQNQSAERSHVLEVSYPLLDYMDVFLLHADGTEISPVQKTGDRLPFDDRYRPHRSVNDRYLHETTGTPLTLIRVQTHVSVRVPS